MYLISQDKAELSRQQASVILENIRGHHDNRMAAAGRCDTSIASYKSSKDQKKFKATNKDISSHYNEATKSISAIQKELAILDTDNAAKVQCYYSY